MDKVAKKIAIVERWGTYLDILADSLQRYGHQVLLVSVAPDTYQVAAEQVSAFSPDLVFTDHSFGIEGFSGETLVQSLSLPKARCVGIHADQGRYCGQVLQSHRVPTIGGRLPEDVEKLLAA